LRNGGESVADEASAMVGMQKTEPANVARIADVARLSGVSKATVSKVLHPSRRYDLSETVRARVTRAAAQLGYRPNWRGQLLVSGKTMTIGLLYARTTPLPGDTYERIVAAAAGVLLPRGYHLMHSPLIGDVTEWQSLLQAKRIDGCLVIAPMELTLGTLLCACPLQSVLVNIDTELPLSQVQADDAGGMTMLVEHLIGLGHVRIVFCQGKEAANDHAMQVRAEAFAEAMRQARLEPFAAIESSVDETVL
jgi:LacI family transcriptional regulator